MSELHKALGDITSIRRQVAAATEFRGYGPVTMAATGMFAIVAAAGQSVWLRDAGRHIVAYLAIWIGTAAVAGALACVQMYTRTRRMHSGMSHAMLRMAVEQFLPSLATGLLVTIVLLRAAPAAAWMLPGLWQIFFSLGIFSSCRFLPRPMLAAAAWYLICGLGCLAMHGDRALLPSTMGTAFGAGQMLVAAILLVHNAEAADEG